jgi:hypothetical protein
MVNNVINQMDSEEWKSLASEIKKESGKFGGKTILYRKPIRIV